jgi:serine/threonine protein kinase
MSTCPRCQAPLEANAPEGLCPGCLLEAGLEPDRGTPLVGWSPPDIADLDGRFADLDVVRLLGQGGMGAVYEARQRKLDRRVALKVLPPELGEEPGFAERLAREARTLAKLSHQNIVGIHDFGTAGDLHYVVMEYVDGKNLRQLLADARMQPGRVVEIARQVCDGLHYAHEQGVVHRDIKPENILIDATGRVRIADFGLAKLVEETKTSTLTGPHDVMGTVHYMAPEQVDRAREIDRRADLYALGVVLYEMLTGQLPIGRVPPPSHRATTHTHLDEIVLALLEHDPAKRPATALDVRKAIEKAAPARPPQAPRASMLLASKAPHGAGPARRVLLWILVAGCVGFAAMFLAWGSYTSTQLDEWRYGEGNDIFGNKNSPDHPFNDPFFERHRRPERVLRFTFDAWDSHLFDLPNGIVGIVAAVLALLASISLASTWRAPWRAYAIPCAYGLLHTLVFLVWFVRIGGSPAIGSILTVGVFIVMAVAALQMRPAAQQRGDPTSAIRRSRAKRRRKSERRSKSAPDHGEP